MPPLPKRRHSTRRGGKRAAGNTLKSRVQRLSICAACGAKKLSHVVCPACGAYLAKTMKTKK